MKTNKYDEKVQRGDSTLLFKAGFWYVIGNFAGRAVTFITTPFFARLMTTSDYGEFSNFVGWVSILSLLLSVELQDTLSRAYYDFRKNYDDYISTVTLLGILLTLSVYIISVCYRGLVYTILAIPEQYIHILFFYLLFSFCRYVYYAREKTMYRYKTVAVVTFLSSFVPTIISAFLVYYFPESNMLSARIYGYYIPSSLIGLFCMAALFRKAIVFKMQYCRYALVLSIPLLVHYLTADLLTSTNIVITKSILGAESAALFSVANSATHILTVFFQATSGALTTWIMDNLELGNDDKIRKGTFIYVALLAIIIFITVLFTPEIIYILGGDKYATSITFLPGLTFATFIQSVTTIFTIILTYDKNVVKTAFFTGIFALVSIIAKWFLLSDGGLIVLIYVNIAVFVMLFFINYYFAYITFFIT